MESVSVYWNVFWTRPVNLGVGKLNTGGGRRALGSEYGRAAAESGPELVHYSRRKYMRFRDIRMTRMIDRRGPETGDVGVDERIARAARLGAVLAVSAGDRILVGKLVIDADRKSQRRLGEPPRRLLHLPEGGPDAGRRRQLVHVQQLL
jgi:hypothetical protein